MDGRVMELLATKLKSIHQGLHEVLEFHKKLAAIQGIVKGKIHISTSNYHVRPIFNLKLQNQTSCTIKLSKSDEIPLNPNHPSFDPTWQMVSVHVTTLEPLWLPLSLTMPP